MTLLPLTGLFQGVSPVPPESRKKGSLSRAGTEQDEYRAKEVGENGRGDILMRRGLGAKNWKETGWGGGKTRKKLKRLRKNNIKPGLKFRGVVGKKKGS